MYLYIKSNKAFNVTIESLNRLAKTAKDDNELRGLVVYFNIQ